MKREEIYRKLFELEFCEPKAKPAKEQELNALLDQACKETNRQLYVLKLALLKTYPQYRAKRLRKELPELPFEIRGE